MALALDIIVALLLAATIGFCALLHRRLAAIRKGQQEMQDLINSLNQATERAAVNVAELKRAGTEVGGALHKQISEARQVSDDFAFMLDRGKGFALQLEEKIRQARDHGTEANENLWPMPSFDLEGRGRAGKSLTEPAPAVSIERSTRAAGGPRPASRVARELLEALEASAKT